MSSVAVRVSITWDAQAHSIPTVMSSDRQMSGFMVVRSEPMKVWPRVTVTCSVAVISVSCTVPSNILMVVWASVRSRELVTTIMKRVITTSQKVAISRITTVQRLQEVLRST